MIGLMFFGTIFLWFSICFSLLVFVSIKKYGYLSKIFSFIFGVILLVAPFYDEIIGRGEFEKICKEGAVVTVDEAYARGKTVTLKEVKRFKTYKYRLPIKIENWSYKDVVTGEVLISWNKYRSDGGWLSQKIKLMGETGPFTFNGYCHPEGVGGAIFTKLDIKQEFRSVNDELYK